MSYIAKYWSTDASRVMLGGVRRSASSRFSHREDAQTRLDFSIRTHAGLDKPLIVAGEIIESDLPAEIVRHCEGAPAQAVGGRCPKCKLVITYAIECGCGYTIEPHQAKDHDRVMERVMNRALRVANRKLNRRP